MRYNIYVYYFWFNDLKCAFLNVDYEMLDFLYEIGFSCNFNEITKVCRYNGDVYMLEFILAHGAGNQIIKIRNINTLHAMILDEAIKYANLAIVKHIFTLKLVPITASIGYAAMYNYDVSITTYIFTNGVPIDAHYLFDIHL